MRNIICLVVLVVATMPASMQAQDRKGTAPIDTLRVQVVVSRYEGEKRLTTVPLALTAITTGEVSRLSMGTEMPIRMAASSETGPAVPVTSVNYKSVGTSVTAATSRLDDGRYRLSLVVESSWIDVGSDKGADPAPTFGSLRADEKLVLSDGQSMQFTSAANAASGQVVKVDVTVTKQH
jgi:Flp pilus assembly secretin CpaC